MNKYITYIILFTSCLWTLPGVSLAGNTLDKAGNPTATAVTAYSLRLLSSAYTGKAINVRRSSDNTTQDIGFTSAGDLDTASLKTFVGTGTGYVTTWYDQSGNGINATQTTNADQPVIVTSGVINRDNGRPAIYTSGTGYLSYSGMTQFNSSTQASRMDVGRSRNGNSQAIIAGLGTYQLDWSPLTNTTMWVLVNSGSILINSTVPNTNALMAVNAIRNTGASKLYVNNVLQGTNTNSIGNFGSSIAGYIGVRFDGAGASGNLGAFSESILFNSVLTDADRGAIDTNQMNYYSLVNHLDKVGSPTAQPVTAFSLRQLGSTYTGKAINVRRSSDNTTQDIGFTTTGDLDTASLKTFVGSGNGYVTTWYDQSGNGINATQTTAADQPLIVTSGAVNRDNGRPAIYTSGTGYLSYSGMSQFNGSTQASRMDVGRSRNGNTQAIIAGLGTYQLDWSPLTSTTMWVLVNSGSILINSTVPNTNALMAVSAIRNTGASNLYVNNVLQGTNTSSIGTFGSSIAGYIGIRFDGAGASGNLGAFSETILFNSVLSNADRNVIDSNQIGYYSLVNHLDKAGSPSAQPVTAFSLRQLGSNYTGKAINVRRSSDNTAQDIGFTSAGDLDTASLKTFVGTGNGYVTAWYDQSGNGINATQTTAADQPQIVTSGVINRDNGRPAIYTSGTGYLSYSGMNQFNGTTQASRMDVGRSRNGNSQAIIAGLGTYQLDWSPLTSSSMWILVNSGSILVNGTVPNTNALMAVNAIRNTGASKLYVNNVLQGTNTSSIGNFGSSIAGYIGIRFDGAGASGNLGAFSETILFNSVLSDADRNAIDSSQINYYSLVNHLDKIGSPAAQPVTAYSLRQLGSTYAGKAINVRRSSDNTTQDIGFTATGSLDTASLQTFVGSGNGYVTTWYDQSGNGINATQATAADQPLIVTSGMINRDNGLPAIYTSGTGYLSYSGMTQFNGSTQASRMDVGRSRNGNAQAIMAGLGTYQLDWSPLTDTTMWILINSGSILVNASVPNTNALMVVNAIRNNGGSNLYANGVLRGTNSASIGTFGSSIAGYIGIRFDGAGASGNLGAFSESILFNSALSDGDRQAIDSNQLQYYAITNGLDKVGSLTANPAAAYSLRLLSSGYSGMAVNVRRSSDNATQDIGFTPAGDLDTASLKTFVGSGNGYVSTWYDQSGLKRNKTQSTASLQPLIVSAGTIYRQASKPVIYFPRIAGSGLTGATPAYLAAGDISVVLTAWSNSAADTPRRAIQGLAQNWLLGPYNNHNAWLAGGYIVNDSIKPWQTSGEVFTIIEPASGANLMYRSGLKELNVSNAYKGLPGSLSLSAAGAYNEPMDGYIAELLEFNSALSDADRSTIEQSTGAYNSIATEANNLDGAWLPAIQPTEAFSMRQLNSGYNGPLVRINIADTYYDVYPDDNGFLSLNSYISAPYSTYNADTSGITYNVLSSVDTGSSVNATVAIWYDQSGRGWNAIQPTDANQPVLIQSGAFVTTPGNNQPALLFNQTNKTFLTGDAGEINGLGKVTINSVFYQSTVNSQVLIGKDKIWNLTLGTNGINGAGVFNTGQNGTSWSDSLTRFVALGLPSLNKPNSITGQYGAAGQNVYGNGIPLGSLSAVLPPLGSGSQPFQISGYGGATGGNYWNGYIQEIILTDSVLGSSDLAVMTASQQCYYNTKPYTSWTGSGSQSWSNACSWSGGLVPIANQHLFIPAGTPNQPVITSTATSPDSLIVAPGATLTISSGGFTDTSTKVILLANSGGMGYLVNTAGASLGTTTIQKWFTGQQGFRALAYPFATAQSSFLSAASANNGLAIQLNSGSGTTSPSSSTPAIPSDSISDAQVFTANAWTNMVNGAAAPNIPYALYYRGLAPAFDSLTSTYGPAGFAFTFSGTPNSGGTVAIPAANSTTAFTMAGNPFTAPVTTLAMTGDPSGNTSYYVWEIPVGSTPAARTTDAGQWVAYLPGNRTLPPMSAMAFVQATASSTISIPTSAMSTSGTLHTELSAFKPPIQGQNTKNIGGPAEFLELQADENGSFRDRLFIRFDDHGSANGTDHSDMAKLFNKDLNIYTVADDNARLAVDFRKEIVRPVPLGIRASRASTYRFVVKKNTLFNGSGLYLHDRQLQTETRLKVGAVYSFTIADGGTIENRFEIGPIVAEHPTHDFAAVLLGNVIEKNDAIQVLITNPDNTRIAVELYNMQGVGLTATYIQSGIVTLPSTGLAAGMYVVRCTKGKDTILLKLMMK